MDNWMTTVVALSRLFLTAAAAAVVACADSASPPASGSGGNGGSGGGAGVAGASTVAAGGGGSGGGSASGSTTGAGGSAGDGGGGGDDAGDAAGDDAARDAGTMSDGRLVDRAGGGDGPMTGTRVVLFAGGGTGNDGVQATQAKLAQPFAVAHDPLAGDFYIAEYAGNRIRRVDTGGVISTVVGTGAPGDAGRITLNQPHHILFPPQGGDLFIGDTFNSRLFRLDVKTGAVAPFAANAGFGKTFCLAFDPKGEKLYVADTDNKRVRAVDLATSMVTTVAGNGSTGKPADGATATQAPLVDPRAIAVDSKGNLYILERDGNALRVVDTAGKIKTVAGTGQVGNSGDGGNALMATMNGPKHVSVDLADDVIITDTENHVIRKLLVAEGKIVRIVGTATQGSAGVPGPPLGVQLARPHGVFVAPDGKLYLSDSLNDRVLRVD
jgi:DNA-binding beta-propeller fold protein YncE